MSNVKGIDVSNNNGSIDFTQVAANGVAYVYLKATEGKSFKDRTMSPFYGAAKANNLKVGAYHFLVSTSSPEEQAQNFYTAIKDYAWDLVPMMDVETMSGFTAYTLCDYVKRFIDTFKQLSPLTLGIYSYTGFIENIASISDVIKDMPFWEANYNNSPWSLGSNFFTNRIGHQYTEKGSVSGVSSTYCDVNVFTEGVLLSDGTIPGEWLHDTTKNKWWYKHADGSCTANGWESIEGKWYYFDADGWMLYDWKKDGNNWYFLGGSNDGAAKTGWVLTDGKWYYFNDSGAMQTGWVQVKDKWYYLDHTGAMQTGWVQDNGKDYCLYSDGTMVKNTTLYGYRFDDSGVASKLN